MIQWIIRIVGLIATIAVTVYITRIARKALEESVTNEPVNNTPIREGK
jgi:hypothetical protein